MLSRAARISALRGGSTLAKNGAASKAAANVVSSKTKWNSVSTRSMPNWMKLASPSIPANASSKAVSRMTMSGGGKGGRGPTILTSAPTRLGSQETPLTVQHASRWLDSFGRVTSIAVGCAIVYFLYQSYNSQEGGGLLGMGSKGAGKEMSDPPDTRMSDVLGMPEILEEVTAVIDFLKDPTPFRDAGANLPKGILLSGPPGTGKTLLARAIAGEANVPFFFASGSEFEEMLVGLGARRIRQLFAKARAAAGDGGAVIFIDEIDALAQSRSRMGGGGGSTSRQTLNQLLSEMDGFEKGERLVVVAATNDPDSLDSALTRPGRFDSKLTIGHPHVAAREDMFRFFLDKLPQPPAEDAVNRRLLARQSRGMTGAAISNVVNKAAMLAVRDGRVRVTMHDMQLAMDNVNMGVPKYSGHFNESAMFTTAIHEAGHALVAVLTPGASPVLKATIVPRGNALGFVEFLESPDENSKSVEQLCAHMDVALAGRAAEEIFLGPEAVTTGASSDLQSCTKVALSMASMDALTNALGHRVSVDNLKDLSSESRRRVDEMVEHLLDESYLRVRTMLLAHSDRMLALAARLRDKEMVMVDEIHEIVGKRRPMPTIDDRPLFFQLSPPVISTSGTMVVTGVSKPPVTVPESAVQPHYHSNKQGNNVFTPTIYPESFVEPHVKSYKPCDPPMPIPAHWDPREPVDSSSWEDSKLGTLKESELNPTTRGSRVKLVPVPTELTVANSEQDEKVAAARIIRDREDEKMVAALREEMTRLRREAEEAAASQRAAQREEIRNKNITASEMVRKAREEAERKRSGDGGEPSSPEATEITEESSPRPSSALSAVDTPTTTEDMVNMRRAFSDHIANGGNSFDFNDDVYAAWCAKNGVVNTRVKKEK